MGSRKYLMRHNYPRKMLLRERIFLWWRSRKWSVLIIITIIVVTFAIYYYRNNNMSDFTESTLEKNIYEQHVTTAETVLKIEPSSVSSHQTHPEITSTPKSSTKKKQNFSSIPTPIVTVTHDPPLRFLFPGLIDRCKMFRCFNHSRCNIAGGFPIYLYDLDIPYPVNNNVTITTLRKMLSANNLLTNNPKAACIYIALVGEYSYNKSDEPKVNKFSEQSTIKKLSYWRRAGRNHVLINLAQTGFSEDSGEAIVAQTTFNQNQFRPGFDVVIPPVFGPVSGDVWSQIPPIATPRRKYLLSFQGLRSAEMKSNPNLNSVVQTLYKMERKTREGFHIQFQCEHLDKLFDLSIRDWALCDERQSRRKLLRRSTFVLILAPEDTSYVSTYLLQTRLFEALESGAIPVILGGDRIHLPYEEVLDWRKAVISLSIYRVTELRLFLSTMSYEDILAFRSQGRMLWERYLGSLQAILDTLLGVIRYRLKIPPQPVLSVSASIYKYENSNTTKGWKMPSRSFKRNFTVGLLNGYEQWNVWGDPFALYPQLPWDPIMTPEPRFVDSSVKMRFHKTCRDLAGDYPVEQFTVVILTYNRTVMLTTALLVFSKMPYLNKIIIVCNGPKPSIVNWPMSGAPIVLVRGQRNSLNNRFLPYHLIETEAVFCVDDDAVPFRKDIYFAFKVWREHRDQIVGFFGRNYEWDNTKNNKGFVYSTRYKMEHRNSTESKLCEVSMILTGAAFIHRYYLWAYWRMLPQAVRNFVDEHMNCEDIAMNFLVSHITRKPPVKVASNWTDKANYTTRISYMKLSNKKFHYKIRDKCMQFFTEVMGYNPLLTTHYRVKSFRKKPTDQQI